MACQAQKPTVRGLQAGLAGDGVNVLLINMQSRQGRQWSDEYGVFFTPGYLLLDASGAEVWRGSAPPSEQQVLGLLADES